MSRQSQSYIKGAAAEVITGGLAFMAVKTLTSSRRSKRHSAAKALKIIGNFMDTM